MMRYLMAIIAYVLVVPGAFAADEDLAKSLGAVIDTPDYKGARWGILITDAKTGDVVYSRNADRLFAPASVTKLYSCGSALVAFGADHVFETPVYSRGKLVDGLLQGDLILVASGDPTLGGRNTKDGKLDYRNNDHTYANSGLSEAQLPDTNPLAGLEDLAKQIKEAGIKEVRGEVLIDDRLFRTSRSSGSGPDTVSPISINDNCIDVIVTPGAKTGDPAKVTFRPDLSIIHTDADVNTVSKLNAPLTLLNQIDGTHYTVRGRIPLAHNPVVKIFPIQDPATFARACFIETLRKQGIRISAAQLKPQAFTLPEKDDYATLKKLAVHKSAPFGEVLKVTLKVSHNLYASTLPCLIAAKNGKSSAEEGLREQGKILTGLGVDITTISFAGGAGGMIADSVTPRATVQLLQGLSKRKDWPQFKKWLPEMGIDGTLATVVDDKSDAKCNVFAKTGTLVYTDEMNGRSFLRSKALAGAMTTKSGRELLFTMIVNDVPLPSGVNTSREGKVLGQLCEIVYKEVK